MIVVAIIAIFASMAVPSFSALFASAAVSSNANTLVATFDLARSEAIGRNTLVIACRATGLRLPAPSCTDVAVGGIAAADWASGWIIFAKPEGITVPSVFNAATDELLRRIEPESVRPTGERAMIVATPATALVAWAGNGLRAVGVGATAPIFSLDHRQPAVATASDRARCVLLSIIGRARAGRFSGVDCVVG